VSEQVQILASVRRDEVFATLRDQVLQAVIPQYQVVLTMT
jgi:hypothetical protein